MDGSGASWAFTCKFQEIQHTIGAFGLPAAMLPFCYPPRIQVFDYPTDTEPGNAFSSIFTGMRRVRNAANNSKEIAGRALLVSGGLARAVNRGL